VSASTILHRARNAGRLKPILCGMAVGMAAGWLWSLIPILMAYSHYSTYTGSQQQAYGFTLEHATYIVPFYSVVGVAFGATVVFIARFVTSDQAK
jgi:hypothetical protein